MSDSAIFLGTGSSLGVPVIGCDCPVCKSNNPKNARFRSSIYLELGGKKLLIDAGPDFRSCALRENICHLDGVIFTHSHQDHTAGIDDLRIYSFRNKMPLPCLTSLETAKDLEMRYFFMFKQISQDATKLARLNLISLNDRSGDIDFVGVPLRYFSYEQLGMQVIGIRTQGFAYVTDIKNYGEEVLNELRGVKTLVLSALRLTQSTMHLTLDEAVDFIKKVDCEQAYLTHISHELDHETINASLPSSIQLAYDGLKIIL